MWHIWLQTVYSFFHYFPRAGSSFYLGCMLRIWDLASLHPQSTPSAALHAVAAELLYMPGHRGQEPQLLGTRCCVAGSCTELPQRPGHLRQGRPGAPAARP